MSNINIFIDPAHREKVKQATLPIENRPDVPKEFLEWLERSKSWMTTCRNRCVTVAPNSATQVDTLKATI